MTKANRLDIHTALGAEHHSVATNGLSFINLNVVVHHRRDGGAEIDAVRKQSLTRIQTELGNARTLMDAQIAWNKQVAGFVRYVRSRSSPGTRNTVSPSEASNQLEYLIQDARAVWSRRWNINDLGKMNLENRSYGSGGSAKFKMGLVNVRVEAGVNAVKDLKRVSPDERERLIRDAHRASDEAEARLVQDLLERLSNPQLIVQRLQEFKHIWNNDALGELFVARL